MQRLLILSIGLMLVLASLGVAKADSRPLYGTVDFPVGVEVLKGHTDTITSVEFSPDGRYILSASRDNTARLWDSQTGQAIRTFTGHTDSVQTAVFSPDGNSVLSASLDQTVRVWNTQTGAALRTLTGHTAAVMMANFSPDGKYIITGSRDDTVRLWDAQTGESLHTFTGHTGDVMTAYFSLDGKTIVSASLDYTARLWDVASKRLLHTFTNPDYVRNAVFSVDGNTVMTVDLDGAVRIWDVQSGENIGTVEQIEIATAALSPDSKYIATAARNHAGLWRWDAEKKKFEDERIDPVGYEVYDVRFSSDGKYFAIADGRDYLALNLWDVAKKELIRTIPGCAASHLTFSSSGDYLATACPDHSLRLSRTLLYPTPAIDLVSIPKGTQRSLLWDNVGSSIRKPVISRDNRYGFKDDLGYNTERWSLESKKLVQTYIGGFGSLSPDGKYLLTMDPKATYLWDLENPQSPPGKFPVSARHAIFSPDSNFILTSTTSDAKLWDIKTKRSVQQFRLSYSLTNTIDRLAFSPDGKYLFTGTEKNKVYQWDVQTGKLKDTYPGYTIVLSPDNRHMLLLGTDRDIYSSQYLDGSQLWDIETGQSIQSFTQFSAGAFSPDGKTMLVAGADGTAFLWDVQTRQTVRTFAGHTASIRSVDFSPDGKYLLTASRDTTALLWDVQSGKPLQIYPGFVSGLNSIRFSPDSKFIVAADRRNRAWLWDSGIGQKP